MTSRLVAILTIVLIGGPRAYAQLIIPEVAVDTQRLPEEASVREFEAELDSMLTLHFGDDRLELNRDDNQYDLPVQINIYFTDYSPNPQEDKYEASLIITNKKEARFDDKRWEFGLRHPFRFPKSAFNPLTSVIEFYLWMLIGIEEDKFEKFGGRPYFDKARQIFLGSSSSPYYFGWDRRIQLLREYTGSANETFRELNFFYYTGIFFDEEGNSAESGIYLYYAVLRLKNLPPDRQEEFLESNRVDLALALGRADIPEERRTAVKETLVRMDSAHREVYDSIAPVEEGD